MMRQELEEYERQQKDRSKSLSVSPTHITQQQQQQHSASTFTYGTASTSPPQVNTTLASSYTAPSIVPKQAPSASMADYDQIKMRYLRSLNIQIDTVAMNKRKGIPDPSNIVAASAPIPIPTPLTKRLELESSDDDSDFSDDVDLDSNSPLPVKKKGKKKDKEFVPPHQMVIPNTFTVKHSLPMQYQAHKKPIGL